MPDVHEIRSTTSKALHMLCTEWMELWNNGESDFEKCQCELCSTTFDLGLQETGTQAEDFAFEVVTTD